MNPAGLDGRAWQECRDRRSATRLPDRAHRSGRQRLPPIVVSHLSSVICRTRGEKPAEGKAETQISPRPAEPDALCRIEFGTGRFPPPPRARLVTSKA